MVLISNKTVETGTFGTLKLPSKFGVSQCIFEYVYFARPDSIVFGDHVTKVRRDHGRQLAREHPVPTVRDGDPVPVVVPVPDSAAHATIGFVEENIRLGNPCIQDLGFFRNPYVGRSFIAPSQEHRDLKVTQVARERVGVEERGLEWRRKREGGPGERGGCFGVGMCV